MLCATQVHIQNATLAAGVGMGTAAEFMITPYGSLIVGFVCGIISTFGYLLITVSLTEEQVHLSIICHVRADWFISFFSMQPFMEKYLKIQDTCGIHNLHAMPGVLGAVVGAITAAAASESVYGREGWVWLQTVWWDSILKSHKVALIVKVTFIYVSRQFHVNSKNACSKNK